MGPQRVLQAALAVAALASPAAAAPRIHPRITLHERLAIIDLGDPGGSSRQSASDIARRLQTAIVAAGFDPVLGDGVEDALAGRTTDRDEVGLAAALAGAERAYGALACSDV